MRRLLPVALVVAGLGVGCGQEDPPPPPAPTSNPTPVPVPTAVPTKVGQNPAPPAAGGTVNITVTANSTPPGATVTGGGRVLGTTPLTQVVPIPAPAPGQAAQTFDFVFTLAGHQSTTITAAPQNGQIAITAALASMTAVAPTPAGEGRVLNVTGRGGGAIRDFSSVSARATVAEPCIIQELRVTLRGNHTYHGDLRIGLRGPADENYSLFGGRGNPFRTHRVRNAVGKQAQGEWRVTIRDTQAEDFGQLRAFSMRIECQ
ncbi:MAG: proprotein convertase P-domain-containing protein [Myxococcota bacterium]